MPVIVAALVAAVATGVSTPVMGRAARRLGLVDRPGPLKVQRQPVPYLGGVAVALGLAGPVAVERPAVLAPLGLALALGLVDDASELGPGVRLAAEAAIGLVAAVVVASEGAMPAVIAAVGVVVLINAVNLIDGLDGLASSVVSSSAVGFAVLLGPPWSSVAAALCGALLGFLVWNRPPARIFLGDAGSYMLGAALGVMLASASTEGSSTLGGALLFVGVPVADAAVAIVRRARAKQPLMQGDRSHVYDQLVDRAIAPLRVTIGCAAAQALLVVIGLGCAALPSPLGAFGAAAIVAVVGTCVLWAFTRPAPRPS